MMNECNLQNNSELLSLYLLTKFGQIISGGFFIYTADINKELLYASKTVLDIFGCANVDEFKKIMPLFIAEKEADAVLKSQENSKSTPKTPKNYDYAEYCVYRPDGDLRWIENCVRHITTSDYGEVIYESIRDVTEQHLDTEKLLAIDHLTSIFNRRHFDQELMQNMRRLTHAGGQISLIMLDLDKFKAFNDGYGHLAGDSCLSRVSSAMKNTLKRKNEKLFRYGGEEFAVLLPDSGIDYATHIAEDIRQAVRELNIKHEFTPTGFVTISAGIACLDGDKARLLAQPCIEIIRQADLALYQAKKFGRDTVINSFMYKPYLDGRCVN